MSAWRRMLADERLATATRVAIGAVFLYASLTKLDPTRFAQEVDNYRLLPSGLVNFVAVGLPFVELVTGVLLVVGLRTRGAALAVMGCLCAFIVAMSWAWARGIDIECGCFGKGTRIGFWAVAKDCGLLALAVHAYAFDRGVLGLDGLLARRRG